MTTNTEDQPSPPKDGGWAYPQDAPAQAGPGLRGLLQHPGGEALAVGRVITSFPGANCWAVDIPRRTGRPITCVSLSSAINRLGGQAVFAPPEVGSYVLVYQMRSQGYGIILGQVPAFAIDGDPAADQYISHLRGVTGRAPTGELDPSLAGLAKDFVNASQGCPADMMPGDFGAISEFGAGIYALRFLAGIKGSELAKVEAFAIDDLVRVTSRNYEERTALGERSVVAGSQSSSAERTWAMNEGEAMGAPSGKDFTLEIPKADYEDDGGEAAEDKTDGLWRFRELEGFLGDAIYRFVGIPRSQGESSGMLSDGTKKSADVGVYSHHVGMDGASRVRSVAGAQIVKPRAIAVPKRRLRPWDPQGDTPRGQPEEFQFSPDATPDMQARDYLAWEASVYDPANLAGAAESWHMPDESQGETGCEHVTPDSPGADVPAGGHFRPRPTPVDIASVDAGQKPRKIYGNDAFIGILPDGSIVLRDGWGSQITMSRGMVHFSASNDISGVAGRSLHFHAGDDITAGARNSVDITAAQGQARLYAKSDIFVGSKEGGVALVTEGAGHKYDKEKKGEESGVPGILLKTAGTLVSSASQARFDLGGSMVIQGRDGGPSPGLYAKLASMMVDAENSAMFRSGDEYTQIGGQGTLIRTTGNILTEGDLEAYLGTVKINAEEPDAEIYPAKGWVSARDALSPLFTGVAASGADSKQRRNAARSNVGQPADNSKVAGGTPVDPKAYSAAISQEDLEGFAFHFRTEEQYGATAEDFCLVESAWQREWSGAEDWGEGAESAETETAEYPGWGYWAGDKKGHLTYQEANVLRSGVSNPRGSMASAGGKFEKKTLRAMKRHP